MTTSDLPHVDTDERRSYVRIPRAERDEWFALGWQLHRDDGDELVIVRVTVARVA